MWIGFGEYISPVIDLPYSEYEGMDIGYYYYSIKIFFIPIMAFTFWAYFWCFFTSCNPTMTAPFAFAFQYRDLLNTHWATVKNIFIILKDKNSQ